MNKEKAIEYIKRAKEQLSYDLLTIRLCEMARNNLEKALKELEGNMEQNNKQTMPDFELGNLYVFNEEDEDGELTIIGELIAKNESQDTLTFGNQYEIETENFVTDQAFDLRISTNKELREATDEEVILFQKARTLWKKEKEAKGQPTFKPFDKVLVRDTKDEYWRPAFFASFDEHSITGYSYGLVGDPEGVFWKHCIPYNEETKHLLGTTDEWKGGK